MPTPVDNLARTLHLLVRVLVLATPLTALAANDLLTPDLFHGHAAWKHFSFRLLTGTAFFLWLPLAVMDSRFRPQLRGPFLAALAFGAVATLVDLLGVDRPQSVWTNLERMEGLVAVLHSVAFLTVASSVLNARGWSTFFHISIGCCVVICGEAVAQYFGHPLLYAAPANHYFRLDARMGSPVHLAIYVQMHAFVVAMFALRSSQSGRRLGYGLALALFAVVLFGTGTRAAWLTTLGGFALAAWMVVRGSEDARLQRAAKLTIVIAAVVVASFTVLMIAAPYSLRGMPVLGRVGAVFEASSSRLAVWGIAIQGFLDRPLLGWGQFNFDYVFDDHFAPSLFGEGRWWDHPHNATLGWLVSGGGLGVAAYWAQFVAGFRKIRARSDLSLADRALLTGAIAGYFGFHCTQPDYLGSTLMFFALLAFVQGTAEAKSETSKPAAGWIALLVAVPAGFFVISELNAGPMTAAADLHRGLQPPVARSIGSKFEFNIEDALRSETFVVTEARERFAVLALDMRGQNAPPELVTEAAAIAVRELEAEVAAHPERVRTLFLLGFVLHQLGRPDRAIPHLERALELSPSRQFLYSELAECYRKQGQDAKSVELLRAAWELDRSNGKAQVAFAVGAIRAGDEAAEREIMTAMMPPSGLRFAVPPRLVDALYRHQMFDQLIEIYEPVVDERRRRRTEGIAEAAQNVNVPYRRLAASYLGAGRTQDAADTVRELMEIDAEFRPHGERMLGRLAAGNHVNLWVEKKRL